MDWSNVPFTLGFSLQKLNHVKVLCTKSLIYPRRKLGYKTIIRIRGAPSSVAGATIKMAKGFMILHRGNERK